MPKLKKQSIHLVTLHRGNYDLYGCNLFSLQLGQKRFIALVPVAPDPLEWGGRRRGRRYHDRPECQSWSRSGSFIFIIVVTILLLNRLQNKSDYFFPTTSGGGVCRDDEDVSGSNSGLFRRLLVKSLASEIKIKTEILIWKLQSQKLTQD